jgi:hypothetical protein
MNIGSAPEDQGPGGNRPERKIAIESARILLACANLLGFADIAATAIGRATNAAGF